MDYNALIQEMHDVGGFLKIRAGLIGATNNASSEVAARLSHPMVNQVMKLPSLNSPHAKAITDALKSSGYDEEGNAAIQGAIDAKLHVATAASGAGTKYQYLHDAQTDYYTAFDWLDFGATRDRCKAISSGWLTVGQGWA